MEGTELVGAWQRRRRAPRLVNYATSETTSRLARSAASHDEGKRQQVGIELIVSEFD